MPEERPGRPLGDRSTRPAWIAALLLAAASAATATGQVRTALKVYPDTSPTAETLLRNADNHAREGQFAEAIEIYQRVVKDFGDKVVLVPPDAPAQGQPQPQPAGDDAALGPEDSSLYVDARLDCQRRIAAMPAEGRALYRSRVDGQAARWFEQGREARDRGQLRRVVAEAFCSSWGDDALELIGDLAFQDGQFAEALEAYRRLVPEPRAGGRGLVHPDPSVDLAVVAAKKILCRAALGEDPPTRADIEAFAKAYPKAEGALAGRTGPLAEILAEAIGADHLAVPAQGDGRWPTFAGAATRTRVAPGAVDVGSLQWRIDLAPVPQPGHYRFNPRRGNVIGTGAATVAPDRLLGYHPIVVGEQVIVADERVVRAYDLNQRPADGGQTTPVVAWEHEQNAGLMSEAARTTMSLARYTLTAFGDRIYARLGPPPSGTFATMGMGRFGGNGGMGMGPSPSQIVALDRAADGKVVWKKDASEINLPRGKAGASRSAAFEGTPVADARGVYVVLTERAEMTSTYVACLDPDDGSPRWVRYICEANTTANFLGSSTPEINHRLLALDGPTVYYQTNLGAVVALDVESGGIRWLSTYPWQGRGASGEPQDRDLNPAIVHDGLVIVAPDDTASIYAYDAATGRMVWKTRPVPEVRLAHLLGVAKGHLVATGDRVLLYDVKTGALARSWPDGVQTPQGYGRGLLAGDRIYWPTKTEIHILDLETGARAESSIKLSQFQAEGGNLAVGDGFLVVAGANSMVVFCQNRRLMERYRDEIARAPEKAINYYRLARAAEASGMDEEALENFGRVVERASPSEMIDGLALVDSARDHRHHLLMRQGDRARKAKDLKLASELFGRASEAARAARDRLAARLELATVELDAGRAASAVTTLQSLLADEKLRTLVVPAGDGLRSVRADLLIADRLSAIVREQGREAYAEFDRAARAMLDRGLAARDPRLLAEVGRSYPASEAAAEALLALGQFETKDGHAREAVRAYKRLLATDAPDSARARAAWGLARAYEAEKLWVPAREAYQAASARFGGEAVEGGAGSARLADLVAARLALAPFDRMAADSAEPALSLPLGRSWGVQWPAAARPLAAEGTPPSPEQGRIFLIEGTSLRAVDPATGSPSWAAELGGDPVWAGYLADRLVVATHAKVVGLDRRGAIEWQYDPATPAAKAPAGPFDRPEPAEGGREQDSAALQDFRVVGGRVVCLRGDQAIVAIDGETGLVDWTHAPSVGRINPRLLVGAERIVLQVRKPNAVFVLDTATGRKRAEFPQPDEQEEWARDPLAIDDDRVVLVPDRKTVALFDLNRGVNAWTFRESIELPRYGPPRVVGDHERLLVVHDGTTLIRLDPRTGQRKWSRPIGADSLAERPEAFALSGERFFVASGSDLVAIAVADGTTAWRRKLIGPASGWSVLLSESCVVAYPNPARLENGDELTSLPVVFRRRDDGRLVERLVFPAPATDPSIRLAARGVIVATRGGLWALDDRRGSGQP